jgi:spore germination cell wall hydrolase CwlJ-like protein
MKTLCSIMAWLSTTFFCFLVAGALFQYFYILPHVIIPLAIPHQSSTVNEYVDTMQLDCLAQNVFFEARGENAKGKMFVAMVVMERTQSPHFPSTVCGVVKQTSMNESGKGCQFSWTCDRIDHTVDLHNATVREEWMQSYVIARMVMIGQLKPSIDMAGVTHYHAKSVKPFWAKDHKDYKLVATVGNHMFYRWKKAMLPKLNVAMN